MNRFTSCFFFINFFLWKSIRTTCAHAESTILHILMPTTTYPNMTWCSLSAPKGNGPFDIACSIDCFETNFAVGLLARVFALKTMEDRCRQAMHQMVSTLKLKCKKPLFDDVVQGISWINMCILATFSMFGVSDLGLIASRLNKKD